MPSRCPCSGDIDALGIALRNLIDNALKHGGNEALGAWAADFRRTREFGRVLPRRDGFGDFEHPGRVMRLVEH